MVQGSIAIGVSSHTSDVDAVLLVPSFVNREDLFMSLVEKLEAETQILDLVAIPDTFVPLIRLTLSGFRVDLVISRLGMSYIPTKIDFDLPPEDLYYGMDQFSIRGLSGLHLATQIQRIAADSSIFPNLLRVIRSWVYARRISQYVYGFPPSVAWAVMVAYICKRMAFINHSNDSCVCNPGGISSDLPRTHVDHSLSCLVHAFFAEFASWPWPRPVQIAPIQVVPDIDVLSWDPQNSKTRDELDLMPIITPVFPNRNATFTIRPSTRQVIVDELNRGLGIVSSIVHGQATWDLFFSEYDVREHCRHFILFTLRCTSKKEFNLVRGLIDSRLRDLAQILEDETDVRLARICSVLESKTRDPQPASTVSPHHQRQWLVAMAIDPSPRLPSGDRPRRVIDVTGCVSNFYHVLRDRDAFTDFSEVLAHCYLTRFSFQMI